MSSYDYTLKILLLGDVSVEKTAFSKRFCYNIFNPSERLTIGVDFHVKTIELNNTRIKLQLWDPGGEERFRFLLPTYCLGADGAFLLYDITKPSTLDNVLEWINIVRQKAGPIPIVLIGSKLYSKDSQVVSTHQAIKVVENYNLPAFAEICSETGQNVDEVFKVLTKLILERTGYYQREDQISLEPVIFTLKQIPSKYKINEYLELRLEDAKTNIYVGGRLFNQCKHLLLDIPITNKKNYDKIESIGEVVEKLDHSMERGSRKYNLSYIKFWGHCSNLQAWYENNYDTTILLINLAFPLLRALVEAGDPLAKRVFKEEIAIRLESGYHSVVLFLANQGYLNYLNDEELETVLEKPKFIKNLPKWFLKKYIPNWLTKRIRAKLNGLKCPYCDSKISNTSIQRFLNGKSMRCEYCYTNIIENL
jgi:small GTP-binding protein